MDLFRFRAKQTECGPSQRASAALKLGVVGAYRLGNFICWCVGGLFQLFLGRGGGFRDSGAALCLVFWQCLGTVMALLGLSLLLPIEDQVSSCLSSWSQLILISLCCVLGLRHSFRSCALPLYLLLHNEYPGLISFRISWLDVLAAQGTLKSLLQHTVQKHQFFGAQPSLWPNSHIHTWPLEKP